MTKGTFSIDRRADGKTSIIVEDYGVEEFGGADYEMIYTLDIDNLRKLTQKLAENNQGSLEQMIEAEFGIHLDMKPFGQWLKDNGINYEFFSWIS